MVFTKMRKKRTGKVKDRKKVHFNTPKRGRKYGTILGIRIDSTELVEVLSRISNLILAHKKFLVVTPNPEIIMKARHDAVLYGVLNSAEISLPDGAGLVWASRLLALRSRLPFARPSNSRFASGETDSRTSAPKGRLQSLESRSNSDGSQISNAPRALTSRVSGADVMEELVKLASERGWRVFLLGGKSGIAARAAENLIAQLPNSLIASSKGPWLDNSGKPISKSDKRKEAEVIKQINDFGPELLFVGFGAPKQEKWTSRNMDKLDTNCIMVVGGAFDYISGRVPRAPLWMRNLGFEWLFRLIVEPWRIGRQLALLKFAWAVITSK